MWDAAFANQAIIASDLVEEYSLTLKKGHDFVKASQVLSWIQATTRSYNLIE